ncbi:MAG: ribonuclease J [Myxococcota bacterium]
MTELRITPLGGLGRIGGNLMIFETPTDLVVVDCGMLFPGSEHPGVDYLVPDTTYLAQRRHKLRAYVITHGHEDHIGALTHVVTKLPAPIYATGFTLGLITMKFGDRPGAIDPELHRLRDNEPVRIGDFVIEPIAVTHSIPDAVALAITTPVGVVVMTGDFKLDEAPLDGRVTNAQRFKELGDRGVVALLSDSTNAERPGRSWSEKIVTESIHRLIDNAPNRVCLTTFSSHIHRVQAVIDASWAAGRTVIPVGRSVAQNVQMSLERGYLKAEHGALADPTNYEDLPRSHVTVIASGSQGEPMSSMTRIAAGTHGYVRLDRGDRVLWSSRQIPGNELAIATVTNNLLRAGVELIDERIDRVHTTGHAFADELADMIGWVKPKHFIPVHGEYRHLVAHAKIAERMGVAQRNIHLIEDGQPLLLRGQDGAVAVHRDEPVPHGFVFLEGDNYLEVGEVVLRDRRLLAETGIVVCVAVLNERGDLVAGPEIATRGVVHVDESADLLAAVKDEARRALAEVSENDDEVLAEEMRVAVRRFFRRELGKKPLVVPLVMRK